MKKHIFSVTAFALALAMLLSFMSISIGAQESVEANGILDENITIEDSEELGTLDENSLLDTELGYGRIPKDDESEVLINNIITKTTSTIASGVYKIRNTYNGMYLNVAGTGADAGSSIQQRTGTSTDNNLNQLFKITFLGIYGSPALEYYSIRPMTNSRLGLETPLSGTTRYATVETISTNDAWSSLLYNHLWAISANGNAYTIKNGSASTSSYLTAPANYTQGAAVYTTTSIGSSSKWAFEAYSGEELDHIEWPSKSTMLIAGGTFDYDAYMYSSRIGVNGPLTFSVTNADGTATDKAIINSSTGVVQALKPGQIRVRATYSGAPWIWYWTVTIKECFVQDLVDGGFANPNDIRYTDDGFYMLMTPLSSILNGAGIYAIYVNSTSTWIIADYYDDWYLYAIESSSGYTYSMIKMREEENDGIDGDTTGVTVSFVELDYTKLTTLIESNTTNNSYQLYLNLNSVTGPETAEYNVTIANYFSLVSSKAAYLIAEEFVQLIVDLSCVNGTINAPANYINLSDRIATINAELANPFITEAKMTQLMLELNELERVPTAVEANNSAAGYSVFNLSTNKINIANSNNLTIYEKYAILMTHTSNVTFNSFAAEVLFHADALDDFLANVSAYYDRALRADMSIGEDYDSGWFDDYYDLDSDIVQAQVNAHGEY